MRYSTGLAIVLATLLLAACGQSPDSDNHSANNASVDDAPVATASTVHSDLVPPQAEAIPAESTSPAVMPPATAPDGSGQEADSVPPSENAEPSPATVPTVAESTGKADLSLKEQIAAGKPLYTVHCTACHQTTGLGLPPVFPPLAKSDYLAADPKHAISVVLHGLRGTITVNGKEYNSVMPPVSQLKDDEVANLLTYVLNSWDNPGGQITASEVAKVRAEPAPPSAP